MLTRSCPPSCVGAWLCFASVAGTHLITIALLLFIFQLHDSLQQAVARLKGSLLAHQHCHLLAQLLHLPLKVMHFLLLHGQRNDILLTDKQ